MSCSWTIRSCAARRAGKSSRWSELIGATHTLEEIRKYIEADSLGYLSLDGLLAAVGSKRDSYCTSCYTGQYPVEFPRDAARHLQLPLTLITEPVAK